MDGDVLVCTRRPPEPTQQSSPVDCTWPEGVEVSWLDGQRPNMSDADILGYLLQEQQVYVELTFPAPILKSGLVLIDSPGVGEVTRQNQKPLTKFVLTEAQKADAFVYVLDAKRGTPTEEDARTLNALLGYRNQISRLDVQDLLEDNSNSKGRGLVRCFLRCSLNPKPRLQRSTLSNRCPTTVSDSENCAEQVF